MKIKESLHYSHLQMVFLTLSGTLVTGIFLNDYLLKIGFNEYHFGVLYSILSITGFVAFPVSFYANKVSRKRRFYMQYATVSILFLVLFIAAPYIPDISKEMIIWISIFSMGGSVIASGVAQLVLFPWLYQVAGAANWAKFFTLRLSISFTVAIICTLFFGLYLNNEGTHISSALFIIGVLAGGGFIAFSGLVPEYKTVKEEPEKAPDSTLKLILIEMMKDKGYVGILIYGSIFAVGIGLFTPFVYPYILSEMHISSSKVSIFQSVMMLTSVISLLFAAKLTNRVGNLKVFVAFNSVIWIIPLLLLIISLAPTQLSYLLFALGGVEGGGFILVIVFTAFVNLTMEYTPENNKTLYLSLLNFIKALFLSCGSFIGGVVARNVNDFELLGLHMDGYQIVFVGALVCLLMSSIYFLSIKSLIMKRDSLSHM